jgi:hypothetical protein
MMFARVGAFWVGAGIAVVLGADDAARNAVLIALSMTVMVVGYNSVVPSRVTPPAHQLVDRVFFPRMSNVAWIDLAI